MDGIPCVGLTSHELEKFAKTPRKEIIKTSRRDFAYVTSNKLTGATTVSGTMILSHLAGINVFVTGGLGGVHRGDCMDISADLTELGKTPVCVVCAGVKSILDVGRTLEYLETEGVPVVTVGENNEFPGFYTRSSGFRSSMFVTDSKSAAEMVKAQTELNLQTGMVFAVPIPEEFALKKEQVDLWINEALESAKKDNIAGKDVTPYLLSYLNSKTGGLTLEANLALIKNNTLIGAEIAKNLVKANHEQFLGLNKIEQSYVAPPVFVGVAAVDHICNLQGEMNSSKDWKNYMESSTPAQLSTSFGGVARNAFEACTRILTNNEKPLSLSSTSSTSAINEILPGGPLLLAPVGKDLIGHNLVSSHISSGFNITSEPLDFRTPSYHAVHDPRGDLIIAGADMYSARSQKYNEFVLRKMKDLQCQGQIPSIVGFDANISPEFIMNLGFDHFPLVFEPTSVPKAKEFAKSGLFKKNMISVVTPNIKELHAISECLPEESKETNFKYNFDSDDTPFKESLFSNDINNPLKKLCSNVPLVLLKMGKDGVLFAHKTVSHSAFQEYFDEEVDIKFDSKDTKESIITILDDDNCWSWNNTINIRHYKPSNNFQIVNANGAGDTMVGAFIGLSHLKLSKLTKSPEYRNDLFQDEIIRKHWNILSPKSRFLLTFCLDSNSEVRNKIIEDIMLKARKCAEMTLGSLYSVHPEICKIVN